MKRGLFFSADALIAITLILMVVLVAYPIYKQQRSKAEIQYDILSTLSTIKMSELEHPYAQSLIAQGLITNINKSVLEQIGEFYVKNLSIAQALASAALLELDTNENIGLWYGARLIYAKNKTPIETAKTIEVVRQPISGIKEGAAVTGFSARASLSSKTQTKYTYFGGYIGDGNITSTLDYNGTLLEAEIELATNKDFDLYINENYEGRYNKSETNVTPIRYELPIDHFSPGQNKIEMKADKMYIAGGYIKLKYNNGSVEYTKPLKQRIPGIKGIINLYDGIIVKEEINNMHLYLHYNTTHPIIVTIGNNSIIDDQQIGEITKTLNDSELRQKLNYTLLEHTTTPLRIGLKELIGNESGNGTGNADVILITDLSGSMENQLGDDTALGIERNCNDPLLYESTTKRISLAQCLDKQFIDSVLNVTGNRIAIVGFFGDASSPNKGRVNRTDFLTNNATALKSYVDQYTEFSPIGGTPICAAINSAYKILAEQSNSSTRKKFIITMSDGIPTHTCSSSNKFDGIRTGYPSNDEALWLGGQCGYGGQDQCSTNNCEGGLLNANFSSCRAYTNLSAINYAVGFGPLGTCQMANRTMTAIAQCGHGEFFSSSNASELEKIYQKISEDILRIAFIEQSTSTIGKIQSELFSDSYIEVDSTAQTPYGTIISLEKRFTNTTTGELIIPENATLFDALVTSYSGSKWTAKIEVNNITTFNLNTFNTPFVELGDPFSVQLPLESIQKINQINLFTGASINNISEGSEYNKILYQLIKNISSYSPIRETAAGCTWYIELSNGKNSTINIPENYQGTDSCSYTSEAITYEPNDAMQTAVFNLLSQLDIDSDQKVEVDISPSDIEFTTSQITGIPFSWSTEVQVRVWR